LVNDFSPERAALILAVGLALGVFPILGAPTALCALAAFALRLNFPALQLVNYLTWPLQVALLLPFLRLGSRILGPQDAPAAALLWRFGRAAAESVTGWFCVSLPLGIFIYFATAYLLRRGRQEWFNGLENTASE